jgi:hypothetical protein
MGFHGDLMMILSNLMGFNSDFMGFHGVFMVVYFMVISW